MKIYTDICIVIVFSSGTAFVFALLVLLSSWILLIGSLGWSIWFDELLSSLLITTFPMLELLSVVWCVAAAVFSWKLNYHRKTEMCLCLTTFHTAHNRNNFSTCRILLLFMFYSISSHSHSILINTYPWWSFRVEWYFWNILARISSAAPNYDQPSCWSKKF